MNYIIEKTDIADDRVINFLLEESFDLYLEICPEQIPIFVCDKKFRESIESRWKKVFMGGLNETDTIYAAYLNDEIIGCILIKENGYLDSLFVKEEYRNMKIGTTLLSKVINECIDLNIIKVDARLEAISLYQRFSFKEIGTSNGRSIPMQFERSYYGK